MRRAVAEAPQRYYKLEIPSYPGWLTLNNRPHWAVKAKVTKEYRSLGYTQAMRARLPRMPKAHIICELCFATNRRRDPHNWMPTVKAIIDGVVDAGALPDDSAKHLIGPDLRLGPLVRSEPEKVIVHIYPDWSQPG